MYDYNLYTFLTTAVKVGFQFAHYIVEEEDEYVEVCVELTHGELDRSVTVLLSTMDGSAEGIIMLLLVY